MKKRQITQPLYTMEQKTAPATSAPAAEVRPKESGFGRMTASEYIRTFATPEPSKSEEQKPVEKKPTEIPKEVPRVREEKPSAVAPTETPSPAPIRTPVQPAEVKAVSASLQYRIIGEAFHSYVLVEMGEKLLVIDKHAAHERILFEQLKAGMHDRNKASQLLMLPLEVMMTSEEIQMLNEFKDEIEAVGFSFQTGRYTVSISEIPEGISTEAVTDMLTVIADRIKNNTGSAKLTRDSIFEKALYQASCKAAIKAGREYSEEHIRWLVDQLMKLPDITVCPHGRPVAMELTKKNIDHQFERS